MNSTLGNSIVDTQNRECTHIVSAVQVTGTNKDGYRGLSTVGGTTKILNHVSKNTSH